MSTETWAKRFPGSLQIDIPHNTANDWSDLRQPNAVVILSQVYKSVMLFLLPHPAGVCGRPPLNSYRPHTDKRYSMYIQISWSRLGDGTYCRVKKDTRQDKYCYCWFYLFYIQQWVSICTGVQALFKCNILTHHIMFSLVKFTGQQDS